MTKWVGGIVGAAVIALVSAWVLYYLGPPDEVPESDPATPEHPDAGPPPIHFITARVWRDGSPPDEGIKGEISRTCSGSTCAGTVNIGSYFPGLPKSLEIRFRCGDGNPQSATFPEAPGSGRVSYKVDCPVAG